MDLSALTWRTSSFSGGTDGTNCVEVALPESGAAMRDSKNAGGPVLLVPRDGWGAFLRVVARG